jgi:hypothetical protein
MLFELYGPNYSIQKWQQLLAIEHYQKIINSHIAFKTSPNISNKCLRLIALGVCMLPEEETVDFFGQFIPSRHQVKDGVGSYTQVSEVFESLSIRLN